jgi:uncharacterized protein (DUF302 family)
MRVITAFIFLLLTTTPAAADQGLITKRSPHSVETTLDRLENVLREKGMTIVLRWRHHEGAEKAGLELRPTELLVFGNPKLGTQLMTSGASAGIDLPMKALAWQDAQGQVWLAYNDPAYIAQRHGITDREAVIKKMSGALKKFTDAAVSP